MRVVVDSNMLESDELREFLSFSPDNRAVLTGYAWMEAYRHDAVRSIVSRLSVLREFPTQVDVLKGARSIAALRGGMPRIVDRMIRANSQRGFSKTVEALEQVRSGDPAIIAQILDHGDSAQAQASDMILGVPDILAAMPEMQEQMFDAAELRRIRTGAQYTSEMKLTIFSAGEQIAETLFATLPDRRKLPSGRACFDAYLYRFALAIVLYVVEWIGSGSQHIRRHDRVHNDIVDLTFATFATYFNGLMSQDAKALRLYWNLRGAVAARGGLIPSDFTDRYGGLNPPVGPPT